MTTLAELRENYPKKYDLVMQRVQQAKENPAVYINNFLHTFDPKDKQKIYHLPFKLFPFQVKLVSDIQKAIENGEDIFIEKCREMGTTYVVLDVMLWFWSFIPGSNFLLGSRKEQYVDNTKGGSGEVSNKEESLFGKIEYTLNKLRETFPLILPEGFDITKHMSFLSLRNPVNGNSITGESSNPNFSRGGRFKAVLMDEFAFWENDRAAWGATADTTNSRIVVTTPGIVPTKAKRLRFGTDGEIIKVITLPHHLDPRKTEKWLRHEKSRRSEEDFAREIMINWETSLVGRVYPEIEHTKLGSYPYQPAWPLFCSWDFGLDGTVILWWQKNIDSGKFRLIEAYENTNQPIDFFKPFLGHPVQSEFVYTDEELSLIDKVKEWKSAIHFGDPDVTKRAMVDKKLSSNYKLLAASGIYININTKNNDYLSRRSATKVFLQKGVYVDKTPGTLLWLECMKEARTPQRQDNSQATTPSHKPIHDWTSHHRTATEYFAVNLDYTNDNVQNMYESKVNPRQYEQTQINENQILDLGMAQGIQGIF